MVTPKPPPGSTLLDSDLGHSHGKPSADAGAEAMRARLAAALFDEDPTPPAIGRFEVQDTLGAGGMGVVYAARDPELDRQVAVKILHGSRQLPLDAQRKLLREARALAKLAHPNVVTVFEAGRHEEMVFLAMELVEGEPLQRWQRGAERSTDAIIDKYRQAARGLHAAHQQGLVHRDFKPSNALVGIDGRVRVADFGLAIASGDSSTGPATPKDPALLSTTRTAGFAGTPQFMAPEQWQGAIIDHHSDQFSFCVALYEAVFGTYPFSTKRLRDAVESNTALPLRTPAREGPRWLRDVLARGLAFRPSDRWPTMAALAEKLGPTPPKPRRTVRWMALGAGVAAGLFALRAGSSEAACTDAAVVAADDWAAKRESVSTKLAVPKAPYAAVSAATFIAGVDQAVEHWSEAWTVACDRTKSNAASVSNTFRCLERTRAKIRAATELALEDPDAVVLYGDEVLTHLGGAANCLSSPAIGPAGEQTAELERRLGRGTVLSAAGRYADARTVFESIATEAHAAQLHHIEADAQFGLGQVERGADQAEAAVEHLLDAAALAQEADHLQVAADAWFSLSFLAASQLEDARQARWWLRMAESSAQRLDWQPPHVAAYAQSEGQIAMMEDDPVAAIEAFKRALKTTRVELGGEPQRLALALNLLATAYATAGDIEAAAPLYQQSLEIRRRRKGADHPLTVAVEFNIALDAASLGNWDEAVELLGHVQAVESEALGENTPRVARNYTLLGEIEAARGNTSRALEHADRADAIQSAVLPANHGERNSGLLLRANILQAAHDHSGANEALALLLRRIPEDDVDGRLEVENNLAWNALKLEQFSVAREYAERSMTKLSDESDPRRLHVSAALAAIELGEGDAAASRDRLDILLPKARALAEPKSAELVPELEALLARALHATGGPPSRIRELAASALESMVEWSEDSELAELRELAGTG